MSQSPHAREEPCKDPPSPEAKQGGAQYSPSWPHAHEPDPAQTLHTGCRTHSGVRAPQHMCWAKVAPGGQPLQRRGAARRASATQWRLSDPGSLQCLPSRCRPKLVRGCGHRYHAASAASPVAARTARTPDDPDCAARSIPPLTACRTNKGGRRLASAARYRGRLSLLSPGGRDGSKRSKRRLSGSAQQSTLGGVRNLVGWEQYDTPPTATMGRRWPGEGAARRPIPVGFHKNKGGGVPWLSNELGKRGHLGAMSFPLLGHLNHGRARRTLVRQTRNAGCGLIGS
jgi:hypothetical protein